MEQKITYTKTVTSKFNVKDHVKVFWETSKFPFTDTIRVSEVDDLIKTSQGMEWIGKVVLMTYYQDVEQFIYLVEFPTGDRLWKLEESLKPVSLADVYATER